MGISIAMGVQSLLQVLQLPFNRIDLLLTGIQGAFQENTGFIVIATARGMSVVDLMIVMT